MMQQQHGEMIIMWKQQRHHDLMALLHSDECIALHASAAASCVVLLCAPKKDFSSQICYTNLAYVIRLICVADQDLIPSLAA